MLYMAVTQPGWAKSPTNTTSACAQPLSRGGTRQLTALGSCRLCCADGEQHFLSRKMEILCSRVTAGDVLPLRAAL